VSAASKVVNAHSTVPILSNVLLSAADSLICVRATDLEVTLEHQFPGEIQEAGSGDGAARLFSGYLGNLPAGIMELTGTRPVRASSVKNRITTSMPCPRMNIHRFRPRKGGGRSRPTESDSAKE